MNGANLIAIRWQSSLSRAASIQRARFEDKEIAEESIEFMIDVPIKLKSWKT